MRLTPESLRATYAYLISLDPFSRWACVPADAMKFAVTKHRDRYGDYSDGTIRASEYMVGHLWTLQLIVAHEALHACQHLDGTETPGTEHNRDFHRRGRLICDAFGWDWRAF